MLLINIIDLLKSVILILIIECFIKPTKFIIYVITVLFSEYVQIIIGYWFDDFLNIDPNELKEILKSIEDKVLIVALKGASPTVCDFFLKIVSKSKADDLKFEMQELPPISVKDVESSQRAMVNVARKKRDAKEITLARIDKSSATVVV
jgi:hypothetical protein